MKILQLNTSVNIGSTGRIAEELGQLLIENGHTSLIGYGRAAGRSSSEIIKIGNKSDIAVHFLITRILDRHGFGSFNSTKSLIKTIDYLKPDILHLHNIHGYYLNVKILFEYIKSSKLPIIWTLHDCWPFTGHCSHFQRVNCYKWQTMCYSCPNTHGYPKSWILDNSSMNYTQKRNLFSGLEKLTIISPSEWLANHIRSSFLKNYDVRVINNGVDLEKFRPNNYTNLNKSKYEISKKYILGVANVWTREKGLKDFMEIRKVLDSRIEIVLVGLTPRQIKLMPEGMTGISRLEKLEDLATLYSGAEVFINPTYADNFPSVNLESQACGTRVITYDTGGCRETIDFETGYLVSKGNIKELVSIINKVLLTDKGEFSKKCCDMAANRFDKTSKYLEYLHLYEKSLS